ncbi:MAG: carbohydrate ABC transporter permease [SAR324 cluster bacterium]|nr:carbohydrate ABC transporter permease [SAR324 cluster bacterium]
MISEIAILLLASILFILTIYPTVWVFIASFKSKETIFSNEHATYTLDNFRELFESGFGIFIYNSFYICLISVFITIFASVTSAYVFSRRKFKYKIVYFGFIMLGQTFPWIILVTPMFILFAKLGFLNSHIGMIFCYVAVSLPFSVYLLVGYLESIPRELDEAALMDGCPPFQIIWKIIFPIMIPGIIVTAAYSFLLMWSEYLFALAFLTKTKFKTMPLELYAFFGEHTTEWGQVMAASALTTIPTLILFLPLQKLISEGLTAGSVKS